jgi:hypothetical protein
VKRERRGAICATAKTEPEETKSKKKTGLAQTGSGRRRRRRDKDGRGDAPTEPPRPPKPSKSGRAGRIDPSPTPDENLMRAAPPGTPQNTPDAYAHRVFGRAPTAASTAAPVRKWLRVGAACGGKENKGRGRGRPPGAARRPSTHRARDGASQRRIGATAALSPLVGPKRRRTRSIGRSSPDRTLLTLALALPSNQFSTWS